MMGSTFTKSYRVIGPLIILFSPHNKCSFKSKSESYIAEINQSSDILPSSIWGHRDRMVIGFIITYAISAYHHKCCQFESR
jgi:hypothetical protein